ITPVIEGPIKYDGKLIAAEDIKSVAYDSGRVVVTLTNESRDKFKLNGPVAVGTIDGGNKSKHAGIVLTQIHFDLATGLVLGEGKIADLRTSNETKSIF